MPTIGWCVITVVNSCYVAICTMYGYKNTITISFIICDIGRSPYHINRQWTVTALFNCHNPMLPARPPSLETAYVSDSHHFMYHWQLVFSTSVFCHWIQVLHVIAQTCSRIRNIDHTRNALYGIITDFILNRVTCLYMTDSTTVLAIGNTAVYKQCHVDVIDRFACV